MGDSWTKDPFVKKSLYKAVWALAIFLLVYIVVNVLFQKKIDALMVYALQTLGVSGIALILFVSELAISPVPPDVALVAVAKSDLAKTWFSAVSLFSLASFLGGHMTYFFGHLLSRRFHIAARVHKSYPELLDFLKRNGFIGVTVGALTPVPFGLTCWLAGGVHVPWKIFLIATFFRPIRFFIYYMIISTTDQWLGI